jgi:hypothetical protein
MSHALVPNSRTRPCSAKSGPRLRVLTKTSGCLFEVRSGPERRASAFHVDVMHHTVSDVIHNQCGHAAML